MGDGVAISNGSGSYLTDSVSNGFTSGKKYRVSLEILEYNSGSVSLPFDGAGGNTNYQNSIGIKTADITAENNSPIYIYSSGFDGSIDNVSVIEVLGDKPRIDYSDSLTEPSLLLEPQSTNLVVNSENLSVLNQTTINLVISPDVSPSGKLNSWRATRTGSDNRIGSSFSAVSGLTYTTSIYAKKVSGSGVINITDYQGNPSAYNLTENWQRYTLTASATSTTGRAYVTLQNIGDVVDFYGLQSEQLSYATSYIPTAGSTATRLGETANNAGDVNVFNSEEGVLYFEAKTDNTDAGSISINNGTLSVRITARVRPDISKIQMAISGSTDDFNYNSETITLSEYNKIAIVYNNGQYYFFINGVKSTIQNKGTFNANSFTQFDFNRGGGGEIFYGKVKNVKVFNKALTDRELEILTIQ